MIKKKTLSQTVIFKKTLCTQITQKKVGTEVNASVGNRQEAADVFSSLAKSIVVN